MPIKLSAEQKRSKWSWYFYDFANSAYASVILLAVYSLYFKKVVVGGAEGTRLWAIAVGIASATVAVLSPLLGVIADFTRFKKQFLISFTLLSVVFTGLLFFVRAGSVFTGMVFFILAEIGYRASQLFYDALLTDVSTDETIGSISGKGWAFGMAGGILSLVIVLLPIQFIGDHMIPFSFILTALFFLVFSVPAFLWLKEIK
jgi:UMF1 family MFS transporter